MEDGSGVTAIEYTLIAALIAVAAVLVLIQIGADVSAPFNTIAGNL
jgi:Flp pilus assembly pilin Flp